MAKNRQHVSLEVPEPKLYRQAQSGLTRSWPFDLASPPELAEIGSESCAAPPTKPPRFGPDWNLD
jgi:hypothetical protein